MKIISSDTQNRDRCRRGLSAVAAACLLLVTSYGQSDPLTVDESAALGLTEVVSTPALPVSEIEADGELEVRSAVTLESESAGDLFEQAPVDLPEEGGADAVSAELLDEPASEANGWMRNMFRGEPVGGADRIRLGEKLGVRLSVESEALYDSNIYYSAPGQEVSDVIFRVRPGIWVDYGDAVEREANFISIGYHPTFSIFTENSSENSFDQDVRAALGQRGAKLTSTLDVGYQTLSDPSIDVGDRTDRQVFDAALLMEYAVGAKTGLRLEAGYGLEDYKVYADSDEWRAELFATYAISQITTVGLGYGYGELRPEIDEAQRYQRALARADWRATEKMALAAWGGADFRKGGTQDGATTGVFGIEFKGDLREGTMVSLGLSRDIDASALNGSESYTLTSIWGRVAQRIGASFIGALEVGFEDYDYAAPAAGRPQRDDQSFFIRPSLRYEFRENLSAEVFYSYRTNDSSIDGFDFDDSQVGASLRYQF